MRLSEITDRLLLGGYEAAKKADTRRIIARYTRGNVNVQLGNFIDQEGLEELRAAGDKAMKRLTKWMEAHKR